MNQKSGSSLFIDKDRETILNFMFSAAFNDPRFRKSIIDRKLEESLEAFTEEMSEISHANNWC